MRARGRELAWAALIACGALAPLAASWARGLTVVHRDQIGQFLPLRWLAGTALREGRLPLWNPYCATGLPYLAETTHGVLHPLSVAAAFLFPSDGLDPLVGLYAACGALGAAVLARTLGASRAASAAGGFAYALAGYSLSMTSNLVGLAGAASGPWIVAGLRAAGAGRGRSFAAFAAGAIAVACGALAGDIQGLTATTAIGLALALEAGGARGAATALAATAAGALLAAVQLVPSWTFLHLTARALPLPAWDAHQWDLAPWRLVETFAPGFFLAPEDGVGVAPVFMALGHPTAFPTPFAESVFLGIATMLLAAFGVRASRTGKALGAAALVVLWFAFGHHLGARAVLDALPVLRGFRYGEKFLAPLSLCVAALAALGVDRVVRAGDAARRATVVALAASAILAIVTAVLARGGLGAPAAGAIRAHLLRGLPHAIVAAAALAACLWLARRGRPRAAAAAIAALVWAAGVAASPFALRPGRPEARLAVAPPQLTAAAPGPRVLNVRGVAPRPPRPGWNGADQLLHDAYASLGANTNARSRTDSFNVDTGLFPLRWWRVFSSAGDDLGLVARRFGVTHLVFPEPRSDRGREIVARVTRGAAELPPEPRTGVRIWEVPHRPWAAFPRRVVLAADAEAALDALGRLPPDAADVAVVEGTAPLPAAAGRVLSVERERERIRIVAESEADATLLVNDAFWPGWRALVDDREVPILPADALVRAVAWPAGRHTLRMEYDPPEVRLGAALSAAGLAALGAAGAVALRRRRSRAAAAAGDERGRDAPPGRGSTSG